MSENPEEINSSFETLNSINRETLQGEIGKVEIKREKGLISLLSNRNVNYSIENKENDSSNINSDNIINNNSTVSEIFSNFIKEPQVVPESENTSILLQENLKQDTCHWQELNPKVCKLPSKQLLPKKSKKSTPILICSRNTYAEALKLNIPSNSTSYRNIEVNHQQKKVQVKNSRLHKEVDYLSGNNENPFGVIGRNVVDRKDPKILSKLQTDFSCYSNKENEFLKDEFSHTAVLDVDIGLNSIFKETQGLNNRENCFRNEFLNKHNLRQEYSHKTDLLDVEEFNGCFTKVTDRELLSHIPKLSDGNKEYIDQCAMSRNSLTETHNFRYPLNINWNNDSSSCGTCVKTLRTDISSSNQDAETDDSLLVHDSFYTTQVEVIPIERDGSFSNSFLSNTLNIWGTKFKSERPVLFMPLYQSLMQDAEAQETNLLASPTHCAIESELSELWKEKSEKSVDKDTKNVFNTTSQESSCENKQIVHRTMEDSQFCEKTQRLSNCIGEVNASNISDSSTVITTSSSLIFKEKGFNFTNVADNPSEDVSGDKEQKTNDRLSINLSSILNEASNIITDFDFSYHIYKSIRNEIQQKFEEITQRISLLTETTNL